jgi:formiminoglutamate deiminase
VPVTTYWCERAWLPDGLGGIAESVAIEVTDGRITSVLPSAPRTGTTLPGLTVPGLANCHSHAFHRALRGRAHADGGTFWTWRDGMYRLAERLNPDSYHRLARAVFGEMVLTGMTSVGEFHYLHHPASGRYTDPNAMSAALAAAASDAGIRLTLLDTCYLAGGFDVEPNAVQRRFSDGSAPVWVDRAAAFRPEGDLVRLGAAIHSVRAVPSQALPTVAAFAADRPLHVHLSEQPAENEDCLARHGRTPAELLHEAGALGPRTVAVHATHLTDEDVATLRRTGTGACFCPTTERDLGDGIGPARQLRDAGVPLSLGSDSHAVIDPFEEARALEMNERLASLARGRFTPEQLLAAATNHAAIGWPEVGRIEPGFGADLVAVRLDTLRTSGIAPDGVFNAATASDVDTVVVAGSVVVREGRHVRLGDVSALLADTIGELWQQP